MVRLRPHESSRSHDHDEATAPCSSTGLGTARQRGPVQPDRSLDTCGQEARVTSRPGRSARPGALGEGQESSHPATGR